MNKFLISMVVFLSLCGQSQSAPLDGSLIFLENCKYIVEAYTDSSTSHTAIIMYEDGVPYVYEAEPPKVHRMTLEDYNKELATLNRDRKEDRQIKAFIMQPDNPYSTAELEKMKSFLDNELNRKYSIKGIVRKRPSDGTHCSQLATNFLNNSARYKIERPYAVSPATLRFLVKKTYVEEQMTIGNIMAKRTWGDWFSQKLDWCSWSCSESWNWCW